MPQQDIAYVDRPRAPDVTRGPVPRAGVASSASPRSSRPPWSSRRCRRKRRSTATTDASPSAGSSTRTARGAPSSRSAPTAPANARSRSRPRVRRPQPGFLAGRHAHRLRARGRRPTGRCLHRRGLGRQRQRVAPQAADAQPAGMGCDRRRPCDGQPGWSPDGKRIAFSRAAGPRPTGPHRERRHLRHERRRVARAPAHPVQDAGNGEDTNPQFSPDGRKILFQRYNVRDTCRSTGSPSGSGTSSPVASTGSRRGDSARVTHPTGRRTGSGSSSTTTSTGPPTCRPTSTRSDRRHRPAAADLRDRRDLNYLGSSYSPDGR